MITRIFSLLLRSKVLVLSFLAVWGLSIEPVSASTPEIALDYSFTRKVLLQAQEQAQSLPTGVRFSFPDGDRVVVNCETLALTRGPAFRCEFIFGDKSFTITDAEFKAVDCRLGTYNVGTEVKVDLGGQLMKCKPLGGDTYNYSCALDPSTLKDTAVDPAVPATTVTLN